MIEWAPTIAAFIGSYLVATALPRDWNFVQRLAVSAPCGVVWALFVRAALA